MEPDQGVSDPKEKFMTSVKTVKALLQFLPFQDRKKSHDWVVKLHEEEEDIALQNEYIMYLLANVQRGRLTTPFNRVPPTGRLKPLHQVLGKNSFDDIRKQIRKDNQWMNQPRGEEKRRSSEEVPALEIPPELFHQKLPRPLRGIMTLCSAFSSAAALDN